MTINLTTFCVAAPALRVIEHEPAYNRFIGTAAEVYEDDLALIQVGDSQGADSQRGAYEWWPLTVRGKSVGELRDDAAGMTIHATVDELDLYYT